MSKRIRKIALEEHFMAPGFENYSKVFLNNLSDTERAQLTGKLSDFNDQRLEEMDRGGIDLVILSQSGPSVQAEPDVATAIARARENNDFLAAQIARHPTRYAGFATLPMQDTKAATAELERTVRELGFKGALINGHTDGVYFDDRRYDPFWEKMQELDVPLYLHPTNAFRDPYVISGHPELMGATWGWGVETGTHALRILFGGVFDRFPGIKLILGHMGEGLPFMRWRFDSRFSAYPMGVKLERAPSAYFGSNILITTSGVCSSPSLLGAIGEMGAEGVMFSVDYPYESTEAAVEFIESTPMSEETRNLICHGNAERIFKL